MNIFKHEDEAEGKKKGSKDRRKKEVMKLEVRKGTMYLLQGNIKFYYFEDSQAAPARPW
jgi:hypothetical protein